MITVLKTIRANQRGAKKFSKQYGRKLIAVRYRGDLNRRVCMTTVEVVVSERFWMPHQRNFCEMVKCLNVDTRVKT